MVEKESTMNKTEKKAYQWFLKNGYKEDEINFDNRRTVDFIVAGKPYEVKKLYQGAVYFTEKQIREFKTINPTILVFSNNDDEPIKIPFNEIDKTFPIHVTRLTGKTLTVYIDDTTEQKMKIFGEVNWSEVCRQAINNYIDSRLSPEIQHLILVFINNKIITIFYNRDDAVQFLENIGVSKDAIGQFIVKRRQQYELSGYDTKVGNFKVIEIKI